MPRVEAQIRYEAPVRIGTLLRIGVDPRLENPAGIRHAFEMWDDAAVASGRGGFVRVGCVRLGDFSRRATSSRRAAFVDRIQALAPCSPTDAPRCPGHEGGQGDDSCSARASSRALPRAQAPRAGQRGLARLGRLRAVLRLGERPHAGPARRAVLAADDGRRARVRCWSSAAAPAASPMPLAHEGVHVVGVDRSARDAGAGAPARPARNAGG